jgi:hypothetical protein
MTDTYVAQRKPDGAIIVCRESDANFPITHTGSWLDCEAFKAKQAEYDRDVRIMEGWAQEYYGRREIT